MRAVGEPDGGARAADLLHRNDMLKIAQAATAVLGLDGDAEQSKRTQFRPEVARKDVRGINLRCTRRDELGGELAHGLTQQVHTLPEGEIKFDQALELLSLGCGKLSLSSS